MPPKGQKAPQKLNCLNIHCKSKKCIEEYNRLVYVCSETCSHAVNEYCGQDPEAQSLLEIYADDAATWYKSTPAVRGDIRDSRVTFQEM
jgi:hypothetical protein